MNNVLRGIALSILITAVHFWGGDTLLASQAQPPVQTPPSSSSGRGGKSIYRCSDKAHAEILISKGDRLLSQGFLQAAQEKYAAAAFLGSEEARKKLDAFTKEETEVILRLQGRNAEGVLLIFDFRSSDLFKEYQEDLRCLVRMKREEDKKARRIPTFSDITTQERAEIKQ